MSRFTRFVAYSAVATLLYLSVFFQVLPLPGVDEQVKDQILPVVSPNVACPARFVLS